MDNVKFGRFVAEIRKEKEMTQRELAELLNLSDKAVSKWERGLSFPDISVLEPLSEVLEVSVMELLRGSRIEENSSLSIVEAGEIIDHSLQLSGDEIERKHLKNKFVILFCCMLVMLLISILINIINFRNAEQEKIMIQNTTVSINTTAIE